MAVKGRSEFVISRKQENDLTLQNTSELFLLSDAFDLSPHKTQLNSSIAVKIPLRKQPAPSGKVRLWYNEDEVGASSNWKCHPSDAEPTEGLSSPPLKLSWAIMSGQCFIFLNRFCQLALAQEMQLPHYENVNNNNGDDEDDYDGHCGHFNKFENIEELIEENVRCNRGVSISISSVKYGTMDQKPSEESSTSKAQSVYASLLVDRTWQDGQLHLKFSVVFSTEDSPIINSEQGAFKVSFQLCLKD